METEWIDPEEFAAYQITEAEGLRRTRKKKCSNEHHEFSDHVSDHINLSEVFVDDEEWFAIVETMNKIENSPSGLTKIKPICIDDDHDTKCEIRSDTREYIIDKDCVGRRKHVFDGGSVAECQQIIAFPRLCRPPDTPFQRCIAHHLQRRGPVMGCPRHHV